jgi:hypothetical protein
MVVKKVIMPISMKKGGMNMAAFSIADGIIFNNSEFVDAYIDFYRN